jgi:acyl carrier protein
MAETAPPEALVREIKELIIEALMLQDMTPEDIDEDAPLIVEGLGLDSIDVLEMAMAIGKKYGVKTKADDAQNRQVFASVRNLARFVHEQRTAGAAS